MIHIEAQPWARMVEHARATYPNECCGAMIGAIDGDNKRVSIAIPLDNVSDGPQRGATFTVSLPLAEVADEAAHDAAPHGAASAGTRGSQRP